VGKGKKKERRNVLAWDEGETSGQSCTYKEALHINIKP
jgi:hypothetical protein